ncbi:hypothetical protein AHMF7605_09830 [Adhaeribacter arboris]|uniref:Uncharacterized protein n=1 Tax=Adhaeribacter arboris TaxID=2072846 RepID=A0A2T2YE52_9BACT|nr:MCP four helix bundle domain-containing protein [Adhaeribacter arboris]PSR53799.1 hypothetical protein AHMF7605_09830 [Adhaeribacter arboris]
MKTRNKLKFSFWLLFGLVVLGGALSLYYLRQIARSSEIILKDNYNTLTMTREMRKVLDNNDVPLSESATRKFTEELVKEENNITEKGEAEAVARLRQSFTVMSNNAITLAARQQAARSAQSAIHEIEELNMQAVLVKTNTAQKTIKHATIYLSLIGGITFLIMFSFIFNLPDLINASIKEQVAH